MAYATLCMYQSIIKVSPSQRTHAQCIITYGFLCDQLGNATQQPTAVEAKSWSQLLCCLCTKTMVYSLQQTSVGTIQRRLSPGSVLSYGDDSATGYTPTV